MDILIITSLITFIIGIVTGICIGKSWHDEMPKTCPTCNKGVNLSCEDFWHTVN